MIRNLKSALSCDWALFCSTFEMGSGSVQLGREKEIAGIAREENESRFFLQIR